MSNLVEELKKIKSRKDIPLFLNKIMAEKICEIGVREGKHLKYLLLSNVKEIIAIDIWKDTGIRTQNDNCYSQQELDEQYLKVSDLSKKDNRIKIVKDFSLSASQLFNDEYFNFIYIDADHSEEATTADICAWWNKVKIGGVLAGHDYSPAIVTYPDNFVFKFGVIAAVDKFVSTNKLYLYIDENMNWYIPKF